jgi:hypothetical protein
MGLSSPNRAMFSHCRKRCVLLFTLKTIKEGKIFIPFALPDSSAVYITHEFASGMVLKALYLALSASGTCMRGKIPR